MREILRANEGYIFTNGSIYGKIIYLAEDIDPSTFYEITQEEYEAILSEERNEELATEDDFIDALGEMGVQL